MSDIPENNMPNKESEPILPELVNSVAERKTNRVKRSKSKPKIKVHSPEVNTSSSISLDISELTERIERYNNSDMYFWKVQAVFDNQGKYYVLVSHKDLKEHQIDIFEDERIEEAAMRGAKIPSPDEHWKLLYKRELKHIQALFPTNNWVSEAPPDKKYNPKLLWGTYAPKKIVHDNDSQLFFINKNKKSTVARNNYKDQTSDKNVIFG